MYTAPLERALGHLLSEVSNLIVVAAFLSTRACWSWTQWGIASPKALRMSTSVPIGIDSLISSRIPTTSEQFARSADEEGAGPLGRYEQNLRVGVLLGDFFNVYLGADPCRCLGLGHFVGDDGVVGRAASPCVGWVKVYPGNYTLDLNASLLRQNFRSTDVSVVNGTHGSYVSLPVGVAP